MKKQCTERRMKNKRLRSDSVTSPELGAGTRLTEGFHGSIFAFSAHAGLEGKLYRRWESD